MKMPLFMANNAENLQIDTQMALFMSESSVSEGAGLRHYGIAGFRDMPALRLGSGRYRFSQCSFSQSRTGSS